MGLLTSNSPGSVVRSHEDGNSRSLLQATLVMRTVRYYGDSSYYPGKKISNHLKKYGADREGAEADHPRSAELLRSYSTSYNNC